MPSLVVFILDRGNDNWLIKYEKTPEVDKQVQGEQGVRLVYTFWYVYVYYGILCLLWYCLFIMVLFVVIMCFTFFGYLFLKFCFKGIFLNMVTVHCFSSYSNDANNILICYPTGWLGLCKCSQNICSSYW